MGCSSPLDVFKPLSDPQAERIAALAAWVGRLAADCAVMLFPLPLADETRRSFEAETVVTIGEVLDEFGHLTPSDRQHFQQIAAVALDRRLAHHAMQGQVGGQA